MSVTVLTAVMDRSENLLLSLPTWTAHSEISQIVIVDWSSSQAVSEVLAEANLLDARVSITRRDGFSNWHLTRAFNAGIPLISSPRVLKLDADHVLGEDFFKLNPLRPHQFLTGSWKGYQGLDPHTNGAVFCWTDDLRSVNGWDERISLYGWDDDDFYQRLGNFGVYRSYFATNSIGHLEHPNSLRLANQKTSLSPKRLTRLNKAMVRQREPWGLRHLKFSTLAEQDDLWAASEPNQIAEEYKRLLHLFKKRAGPRARLAPKLEVASAFVSESYFRLRRIFGYKREVPINQTLIVNAEGYPEQRLQTIAGGLAHAKARNMIPIVEWQIDKECPWSAAEYLKLGCEVTETPQVFGKGRTNPSHLERDDNVPEDQPVNFLEFYKERKINFFSPIDSIEAVRSLLQLPLTERGEVVLKNLLQTLHETAIDGK